MATQVCASCGSTDSIPLNRLCSPCLATKVTADRAAQGLPAKVDDPTALRRLAVLFGGGRAPERVAS